MRRYVVLSRPRLASIDESPDAESYLARTVFEADPSPIATGLLDSAGNELFAIEEMDEIGFIRFRSIS